MRYLLYLIGYEPSDVHLSSAQRKQGIHESHLCAHSIRTYAFGELIPLDIVSPTKPIEFQTKVEAGKLLKVVEVRLHGKQLVVQFFP